MRQVARPRTIAILLTVALAGGCDSPSASSSITERPAPRDTSDSSAGAGWDIADDGGGAPDDAGEQDSGPADTAADLSAEDAPPDDGTISTFDLTPCEPGRSIEETESWLVRDRIASDIDRALIFPLGDGVAAIFDDPQHDRVELLKLAADGSFATTPLALQTTGAVVSDGGSFVVLQPADDSLNLSWFDEEGSVLVELATTIDLRYGDVAGALTDDEFVLAVPTAGSSVRLEAFNSLGERVWITEWPTIASERPTGRSQYALSANGGGAVLFAFVLTNSGRSTVEVGLVGPTTDGTVTLPLPTGEDPSGPRVVALQDSWIVSFADSAGESRHIRAFQISSDGSEILAAETLAQIDGPTVQGPDLAADGQSVTVTWVASSSAYGRTWLPSSDTASDVFRIEANGVETLGYTGVAATERGLATAWTALVNGPSFWSEWQWQIRPWACSEE